eukprot:g8942.t1 g8942   contig34:479404-480396(-)
MKSVISHRQLKAASSNAPMLYKRSSGGYLNKNLSMTSSSSGSSYSSDDEHQHEHNASTSTSLSLTQRAMSKMKQRRGGTNNSSACDDKKSSLFKSALALRTGKNDAATEKKASDTSGTSNVETTIRTSRNDTVSKTTNTNSTILSRKTMKIKALSRNHSRFHINKQTTKVETPKEEEEEEEETLCNISYVQECVPTIGLNEIVDFDEPIIPKAQSSKSLSNNKSMIERVNSTDSTSTVLLNHESTSNPFDEEAVEVIALPSSSYYHSKSKTRQTVIIGARPRTLPRVALPAKWNSFDEEEGNMAVARRREEVVLRARAMVKGRSDPTPRD